ncbi:hypothetical protein E4T44_02107 [Aureobasidium sp. EXF-8845]|nr:hypothetical protein E4T44_02107 [Aureobasidium sp. EXF-8845]KAI4856436.1 hypothetical protein E4T45_02100 [Aureobasidium sp. EXF-8846]
MEATAETHNDLVNLLNEKNIAITEVKAEAAQSAEAVNKIVEENCQLKADNECLQAEIRELRIKLWDATGEEGKMNAGRLRDVLKMWSYGQEMEKGNRQGEVAAQSQIVIFRGKSLHQEQFELRELIPYTVYSMFSA